MLRETQKFKGMIRVQSHRVLDEGQEIKAKTKKSFDFVMCPREGKRQIL